jgi:hypothetical protein
MIFADFRNPVKTSDLEKALSTTLSELGYKSIKVRDNYPLEKYLAANLPPVKEGIEYEVRKGLLEPKMYFGLKFKLDFEEKSQRFVYEQEQANELYGWAYSINPEKYKNVLLDVINATVNKINSKNETTNEANITYYK